MNELLKSISYSYCIFAFAWAIFSVFQVRQMGLIGKLWINMIKTFIVNLLLFPYCLYYALKNEKF